MEKGNFIVASSSSTDCLRCRIGWGGVVRNALITQLCCPALTSCPTFCLQLETKPKTTQVSSISHFLYDTQWHADRRGWQSGKRWLSWASRKPQSPPPRLPELVLLSCYDTVKNQSRTVPKKTISHVDSTSKLTSRPKFVKHLSISAPFAMIDSFFLQCVLQVLGVCLKKLFMRQ